MSPEIERRCLQVAIAAAAVVPVAAGLAGVIAGAHLYDGQNGTFPAGHARYVSGLLLGIGLAFWASIPQIERNLSRVALLAGIVIVGGLCRAVGIALGDPPSLPTVLTLAMELVVTPVAWLWTRRIASLRSSGPR